MADQPSPRPLTARQRAFLTGKPVKPGRLAVGGSALLFGRVVIHVAPAPRYPRRAEM